MKQLIYALSILFFCNTASAQSSYYFPEKNANWEERKSSEFDINQTKIDEAVAFAMSNEYSGSRDLRIAILKGFAREPYHEILGPTKKRGGPAGLIIKNGYIIAK